MNSKYLELWRLKKQFKTDKGVFVAVRDFSVHVAEGEFISIIGHSGCGKSTVLSMVAGLHQIDAGESFSTTKRYSEPVLIEPWFFNHPISCLGCRLSRTSRLASSKSSRIFHIRSSPILPCNGLGGLGSVKLDIKNQASLARGCSNAWGSLEPLRLSLRCYCSTNHSGCSIR